MKDLAGKIALITGGGGGIGLAIGKAFAIAGMKVAVADIDEEAARAAASQLATLGATAISMGLDVADRDAWRLAAESIESKLGPVDVLCNNAGVGSSAGPAETASLDEWRWVFQVNVEAHLHSFEVFLPRMKARGSPAHIVNSLSIGSFIPIPNMPAYICSKHAALALSEQLRLELAGTAIGVSVLCPAMVRTDIFVTAERARPAHLPRNEQIFRMPNPLSRGMDPEYVGRAVLRAVQEDRFYVFTHADYRSLLAERFAGILAAVPEESADPAHREDFQALDSVFKAPT